MNRAKQVVENNTIVTQIIDIMEMILIKMVIIIVGEVMEMLDILVDIKITNLKITQTPLPPSFLQNLLQHLQLY